MLSKTFLAFLLQTHIIGLWWKYNWAIIKSVLNLHWSICQKVKSHWITGIGIKALYSVRKIFACHMVATKWQVENLHKLRAVVDVLTVVLSIALLHVDHSEAKSKGTQGFDPIFEISIKVGLVGPAKIM